MKIRGVVDDRDGGVGRLTTDGGWALHLVLSPWRNAEGELIDGRVVVARCCRSNAELEAARGEHPKEGAVFEVELDGARIEPCTGGEAPLGYVRCAVIEDAELLRFAEGLAPPAEVTDPVLGTLVFEPRLRWYVGRHHRASGTTYKIAITPPDPRRPGPRIEQARAIVAWVDENQSAIGTARGGRRTRTTSTATPSSGASR